MDYREKILSLARIRPLSPSTVAGSLKVTSIVAGAMLAEMVSKKVLKVSHLKIGSSPLYYAPDNESMLESFKGSLGDKERGAFDLLKEKQVLREQQQEPLTRVCLQQLKDFAKPLEVTFDGKTEIFYKWFLLSDEESKKYIKNILHPEEEYKKEEPSEVLPVTNSLRPRRKTRIISRSVSSSTSTKEEESIPLTPIVTSREKKALSSTSMKEEKKVERRKKEEKKESLLSDSLTTEVQQGLSSKKITPVDVADPFLKEVIRYCNTKNITVHFHSLEKKSARATLQVGIPSIVGELRYYCVADNKKRISDTDLTHAFAFGQIEKLPVLYLSRGELTKKAKDVLKHLKGLTFTRF